MVSLFLCVADGDVDVEGCLQDRRCHGPLHEPRSRAVGRLVDIDRLDLQFVDVGAFVVLGVGDR